MTVETMGWPNGYVNMDIILFRERVFIFFTLFFVSILRRGAQNLLRLFQAVVRGGYFEQPSPNPGINRQGNERRTADFPRAERSGDTDRTRIPD